jgi:hypothetical protein
LDTYAEEYAPNNAMPWRNRSVRSLLRSDLARHTPKAGTGVPTTYHNDNRNTKLYKRKPQDSIEDLVTIAGSSALGGIALDVSAGKMYWTDNATDKIQRANLDGSSVEDLVTIAGTSILRDIALDVSAGKMYWTDSGTDKIQRANLDGSSVEDLVTIAGSSTLNGIALDVSAGKMYWTDSDTDKIQRANLDGSSVEDLVTIAGFSTLSGIALDVSAGKMYWTDSGTDKIQRANLDGTNVEDLVTIAGTSTLFGIALDVSAGKMYWTDYHTDKIQRANLDGSSVEDLVTIAGSSTLFGIALDVSAGRMYWTDNATRKIQRAPIPEKLVYDNGFVNHEMPQADLRYAWIAASALTTEAQLPGHQFSSSVPFGPYDDIDYVLSSSEGRGDFIGISGSSLDKSNISVTTSVGSTNFLSKSSDVLFSVYNGPYQHSSWKQVRNHQNPVVRQLVRESILSLANLPKTIKNNLNQQVSSKRSDGITNFKEPVVSEDARPSEHTLLVRPSLDSQTQLTSSFKYTITNDVSTFTNQKIRDRLGIKRNLDATLYKKLKDTYLEPELVNASANPVDSFVQMDYSRVLYPSPINAFLNTTRERTEYAEVAGTGSNGYDRIKQRTFYKENLIRSETAPNSQGHEPTSGGSEVDKAFNFNTDAPDFSIDASSQIVTDQNSGSLSLVFGTKAGSSANERFFLLGDTYTTSSVGGTHISMSLEVTKGSYQITPSVRLDKPETGEDFLIQYKSVATGSSWQTVSTITPASLTAGIYTQAQVNFDPGEPVFLRVAQTDFTAKGTVNGHQFDNYAFRNFRLIARTVDLNMPALNFNAMATDGIRSFPESGSYRKYNGELMQDSDDTAFTGNPLPSLSYLELYNVRVNNTSSGYVERLTEQIAGKNSWYDTYGEYAADVRPHSKNKSIIPEFRMSEHIPYYVIEKGDLSFRSENMKFLSLDGASITSSANEEDDCTFNSNFINRYVRTTDSGRLVEIAEEHSDGQVGEISKVEFSCKALKKLLPYNGFYPKERTVQLGNLLSESLGGNVEGSYEGSTTSYPKQGWMGVLKPLMSPGILYNTIKSGIAVDYPIYTGSVPGLVGGSATRPSDFQLSTGPNYRLPFETLIDLKGNLPEGSSNPVRLVSSFVTDESDFDTEQLFNYKSVWSGEKTSLFELGMHNFLAESVNFFLEGEDQSAGGRLTSFRSKPQPTEGWQFDSDKTYYMDVILRDTVEMNKFIEYSGSKEVVENLKFGDVSGSSGDLLGDGISIVEGSPAEGVYAVATSGGKEKYYLFQNKFDTRGWQQILEFSASRENSLIGSKISMASGSTGIYVLGTNTAPAPITNEARIYRIGGSPLGVINQQPLTASDHISGTKVSSSFGDAFAISSGSDGIYAAVSAYLADSGQTGAAYLFHSKSSEPFYVDSSGPTNQKWQTKITGSNVDNFAQFGDSIGLTSGSDGVYVIVGAPVQGVGGGDFGAAYLFHSKSSEPFYVDNDAFAPTNQKWQTFITSSANVGRGFGGFARDSVNVVSGTTGVYFTVSSGGPSPSTQGEVSLFLSKSSETFYINSAGADNQEWQTTITASDAAAGDAFGASNAIVSGSDGVYVLAGAATADPSSVINAGKTYIYLSQSVGVSEQIMSASDASEGARFGSSVSLISSSNILYAGIGARGGSFAVSGSGAGYLFAGNFGSLSGTIGIQNVQQDYKQHGKLFGLPLEDAYDPAYAAYTPPMFYGESIARIKFSPATDTTYRLDEILDRAEVEEIINVSTDRVATVNGFKKSMTTLQKQNRMPVSSSVNLFGKYFEPEVAFDPETGRPRNIDQTSNLNPSWVISTRFECPILDVSSSKYNELYTAYASDSVMATNYGFYPGELKRFNPRTMWTSYGQPPKGTKRTTLELANSFPDFKENPIHASLIEACGFTAGDKNIGKVRGTKQIFESVVMIPYLDEPVEGVTTEIEGKNFIAIDSSDTSRYADQRSNFERFGYAVQAEQNNGEKIEHTSITRMLKGMQMFNLPPNMDFYKHADITPFAMYFFPFSKDLSRAELADIWQGVMPQSATRTEDDTINVSHDVNKFEFFGNLKDRTLISKMRFMVFKVKQVAKQNYYEITEDATDDSRYQFKFSADGQAEAVPHPSYNWPYDYFSLVEDATIEAKYTIKNNSEE